MLSRLEIDMVDNEMTGVAKILHGLGVPSSIFAVLGAFTFGVGIFQSDVSLTNRKMIAGLLLLAVCVFLWYLPRIVTTFSVGDHLGNWKTYRNFSFTSLLGALLSGAAVYFLGLVLWRLLHS